MPAVAVGGVAGALFATPTVSGDSHGSDVDCMERLSVVRSRDVGACIHDLRNGVFDRQGSRAAAGNIRLGGLQGSGLHNAVIDGCRIHFASPEDGGGLG